MKKELKQGTLASNVSEISIPEKFMERLVGAIGVILSIFLFVLAGVLQSGAFARVLEDVGIALLVLSMVHILQERVLRRREIDRMTQIFISVIAATHSGYKSLRDLGIEKAYENLPDLLQEWGDDFKEAKLLRILKTWCPNDASLESLLRLTHARVQLFLGDPNSKILQYRAVGLGEGLVNATVQNIQAVRRLSSWLMEDQKRSGCVTFFDAWPGVPAIECDGALFVGFYITGIASPCAPWLKINPASEFGKSVLEQFKFKPSQITARLNNPQQLSAWIAQNSQEPVRDEVLPARG